jgi:hypothetical protein
MKISIGDIVDRYSICKLKKERTQIDITKELQELNNEMKNYEGLEEYIDKLYEINGQIWDLESDIRKENEHILGLEEVGRRAIKIRNLNNVRIGYKNEINSKYNEGFIETKINHGSEIEKTLIISLTTVPERLSNPAPDGLKIVLESLCEQNDDDYEVHFNVPEVSVITKKEYVIPEWLNELKLKYKHLKVFRTEDFGPPTKFVPTLLRIKNSETILVVVDDDLVYHQDMVKEHRKNHELLPNGSFCYDGRGVVKPLYNGELRDFWIICVTEPREVHNVQHYKSCSYKKKYFEDDFYNLYLGRTFSDDVLISRYFRDRQIKMFVMPYEKESHLYDTLENWQENQGVVTFPIIRYAHSVMETGCNHPDMIAIQPRFYEPNDLGKKLNENE